MSTEIEEAESALEEARRRYSDAQSAVDSARVRVGDVEHRIRAGEVVHPSELADAKAEVEHAELVFSGTEAPLHLAAAAHQAARADALCDEAIAGIRQRGTELADALDRLAETLPAVIDAVSDFDAFARESQSRLSAMAQPSDRYVFGPYVRKTVDGIGLEPCRGASQLVKTVLPALQELRVEGFVVEQLRTVAAAAPPIPSADR